MRTTREGLLNFPSVASSIHYLAEQLLRSKRVFNLERSAYNLLLRIEDKKRQFYFNKSPEAGGNYRTLGRRGESHIRPNIKFNFFQGIETASAGPPLQPLNLDP